MNELEITHLDPWLKQPVGGEASGRAEFVGRYRLDLGMVTVSETLFLAGGPDGWELWAAQEESGSDLVPFIRRVAEQGPGCLAEAMGGGVAVAGSLQASPREAARGLFQVLLQVRHPHSMPCAPYQGGLLPAEDLSREVAGFQAELERNRRSAEVAESAALAPILEIARRFGLGTTPAGQNPEAWRANCPCGGQHWIMISTGSGQFGCGYCRRKGGPDELRSFCEERGRKARNA
jgi:hypothetical protein